MWSRSDQTPCARRPPRCSSSPDPVPKADDYTPNATILTLSLNSFFSSTFSYQLAHTELAGKWHWEFLSKCLLVNVWNESHHTQSRSIFSHWSQGRFSFCEGWWWWSVNHVDRVTWLRCFYRVGTGPSARSFGNSFSLYCKAITWKRKIQLTSSFMENTKAGFFPPKSFPLPPQWPG